MVCVRNIQHPSIGYWARNFPRHAKLTGDVAPEDSEISPPLIVRGLDGRQVLIAVPVLAVAGDSSCTRSQQILSSRRPGLTLWPAAPSPRLPAVHARRLRIRDEARAGLHERSEVILASTDASWRSHELDLVLGTCKCTVADVVCEQAGYQVSEWSQWEHPEDV